MTCDWSAGRTLLGTKQHCHCHSDGCHNTGSNDHSEGGINERQQKPSQRKGDQDPPDSEGNALLGWGDLVNWLEVIHGLF
jgi:hypothetical protein